MYIDIYILHSERQGVDGGNRKIFRPWCSSSLSLFLMQLFKSVGYAFLSGVLTVLTGSASAAGIRPPVRVRPLDGAVAVAGGAGDHHSAAAGAAVGRRVLLVAAAARLPPPGPAGGRRCRRRSCSRRCRSRVPAGGESAQHAELWWWWWLSGVGNAACGV